MQIERREAEFLQAASDIGKKILELDKPVIVHHFDADGIPAGSIVFSAMYKNGIAPAMICWKKMTLENITKLKERKEKHVIFCDLGAGYASTLAEHLPDKQIFILDHHEPDPNLKKFENITTLNAHEYGFDGGTEISGGGTAYLCFRDSAISQLAIVSAVGDMQDKNGLVGLNAVILKDAVDAGICNVKKDLKIYGRSSRSLISFLSYCTEPFLPQLTGNDAACAQFLHNNSIPFKIGDKYISYYEIDEDNRKKLVSALIEHCLKNGVKESSVSKMIGDVYLFPSERQDTPFYDSHEYAALINACGRNDAADVGVKVCLKDEAARQKAVEIMSEHRQNLKRGITLAKSKTSDLGNFYLLDCRGQIKDGIIGIVAGAIAASAEFSSKPIVAIANDEDDAEMVKISTRASQELIEKGIDLNNLVRKATDELGRSFGGGHKPAAGASVEKRFLPEFLKKCAEVIKEQRATR